MLGIKLSEASLRGDPRWIAASSWTSFAPTVVLTIFVLSIVELAVGILWVSKLGANVEFSLFIQPIIVPAFALFNSIPSAHLHILARVNSPLLAMWFSSILCVVFLTSALVYLAACSGSSNSSLSRDDCPKAGSGTQSVWDAVVALQLVTAVCYAVHFAMAWKVRRHLRLIQRERQRGGEVAMELTVTEQEEKERREALARERWRRLTAG